MQRYRLNAIVCFIFLLFIPYTFAEQFERFGAYEVHYVVFNTRFLQGDIAQRYDIERADNLALINISVLKITDDGNTRQPIEADVSGTASNLMQQRQELNFRVIKEQNAIYALSDLRISDREMLRFNLTVKPKDSKESYSLRFNQMTYIDRD